MKPGDFVLVNGQLAEILAVKGNDLEVSVGPMKMLVKKNKVTPAEKPLQNQVKYPQEPEKSHIDTREKLLHFRFELDIRGWSKEQVMVELESWTDDAILLGIDQATIMHGRGTGVIKETVRNVLRKYKEVESLTDAPRERGGEGVTVVKFRN
jgi:DNA mismatch repair protein MutS2